MNIIQEKKNDYWNDKFLTKKKHKYGMIKNKNSKHNEIIKLIND